MKNMHGRKRYFIIGVLVCLSGILTGCAANKIDVTVTDGQFVTELAVKQGSTVRDVLSQAEIAISEQDVIKPAGDTVVSADNDQIVITRYAEVTVSDGKQEKKFVLTGKTVQDAIHEAGMVLSKHDYLNHAPEALLTNGMEICVTHRLAVQILVDGEKIECLTKADNVEGLLAEQNIALDKKDRIAPGLASGLSDGMKVTVERVSVKEIKEKEPIPFETTVEYSSAMYTDEQKEKTPGVDGEKEVVYQVVYVDGKEESRKPVKETVLKEPVSQVVTKGTKKRRRIVSRVAVDDCDGSGHGYYIITWSDGTVEYEDY